jgi:hypothetical protein
VHPIYIEYKVEVHSGKYFPGLTYSFSLQSQFFVQIVGWAHENLWLLLDKVKYEDLLLINFKSNCSWMEERSKIFDNTITTNINYTLDLHS